MEGDVGLKRAALRELWGSHVKTFITVLALRHVRESAIVARGSSRSGQRPVASPPLVSRSRDVFSLDDDMFPHHERDVVRL